ncbi:DMT family transporter [Streptomonospora nanhaiensis]|uniref:EamA family transporter n=1 Tax=Streptomonospora nanhaiensis TaxID=1323731 RepID=UPI001C995AAD|nr:EamA family transporter [Streptomonospora nanhaiensis]MBX9391762.1 EamA family transporter [Streptomonospora nanhaiensis]
MRTSPDTSRPGAPWRGRAVPAPALVLGSVFSVQIGQALGRDLFAWTGPAGVVALRLGIAALVLLPLWRPRAPRDARTLLLVCAYGAAIAGMNLIYPAMAHLPMGMAVTVQFLGPVAVALAGSRRAADLVWGGLAAAGILLFADTQGGGADPVGLAFAAGSGVSMAAYILLSRRAGATAAGGAPLAAVAVAALITLPIGAAHEGAALLDPRLLAAGAGIAVLSAVVPYSLDLAALRRLPPRVVGVLQSLEPVVGAVAALLVLGERLDPAQWGAVACVTAAAVGAVATRRTPAAGPDPGA